MNKATVKYRDFVLLALFTAIVFVLGLTPLGMVPLGFIKATTLHIPVVIGCLLLGPRYGAILGAMFGLVSFLSNTMSPAALSFAFSPLIPVPVVPWFVYRGLQKLMKENSGAEVLSMAIAGASGAILNTGLVMSLIYFLLRDAYAALKGIPVDGVAAAVLTVVGTNGVAETALAVILVPAIGKILLSLKRRNSRS